MSLKLIELNDRAIKVGDETGIIVQSCGFALNTGEGATANDLITGDEAERQARLQPTNSYNKYWHELSVDPLSHGNGIRHLADIAYSQLLQLAELAELDDDVIFAVPGSFTQQQLAILLGLVKQCPFTAVAMVDSALAAVVSWMRVEVTGPQSIVYADLQLHQVLLTKVSVSDQQLRVESVIQVPGVGNQNFMDLMMQVATDLFIEQCRFNPQHNAESEQQLYNALPDWLQQNDEDKSSLLLQLNAGSNGANSTTASAVHTAKMPRESLINSLNGYYKKINQQLSALVTVTSGDSDSTNEGLNKRLNNCQLLLSKSMASLPGFISSLNGHDNLRVLADDSINSACLDNPDQLVNGGGDIRRITSLPFDVVRAKAGTAAESKSVKLTANPTHALFNNRAIALDHLQIRNKTAINGQVPASRSIVLSLADLPEQLGQIDRNGNDIFLDSGEQEFLLNRQRVSGRQKLALGDSIRFADGAEEIRLIQVD